LGEHNELAANEAAARAHEEVKAAVQAQKIELDMQKQVQQNKMLELQRKLESQASEAEKERLRQDMAHQRELAARDQQVLRNAIEKNQSHMAMLRDEMRIRDESFDKLQEQHKKAMQAYREQSKVDTEKLKSTIANLNQEMEQAVYDPRQPDKFMQIEEQNFDKFCSAAAAHLKDVPKLMKKSVALLGPSGVGKSTVINAFAGKHVTKVDLSECTDEVSMVYGDGPFDFYDVPGSHDARADFYNVEVLHKLKSLHMVLLVCESRVDHVAKLAKLMACLKMPFIVVRNKCDFKAYTPKEWEKCKVEEIAKLKLYSKLEDPKLVFLGKSADPKNGADIQGLSELRGLVDATMATA